MVYNVINTLRLSCLHKIWMVLQNPACLPDQLFQLNCDPFKCADSNGV